MITNLLRPWILARLSSGAAVAILCAVAVVVAWRVLSRWRIGTTSEGQLILERRAEGIGLDLETFVGCVRERRHRAEVAADLAASEAAGVVRTPAVVIGGRLYTGTKSYDDLRNLVNAELAPSWLDRALPAKSASSLR